MAVRSENKIVPVNLPAYHRLKLGKICEQMGLTKSAVIQRLIEQHNLFGYDEQDRPRG
jgi:hypothetical protein